MVTQTISCPHCGGSDVIRHGKAPNGKQKYPCKGCGRCSRDSPGSAAHDETLRERALAAYHERCSQRGVCRVFALFCFGISRQTLITWLKKSRGAAAA